MISESKTHTAVQRYFAIHVLWPKRHYFTDFHLSWGFWNVTPAIEDGSL